MGVPSFYRWLANKYPKTVVNAVEKTEEKDGTRPNPNDLEFDNLYLDMNGIIHPCFHPEHDDVLSKYLTTPGTYEEVFSNIFEYIDRIMMIVRPKKLLYLAIDGVAPRAKMNQQRTRRFRNAKDQETLRKEEDRLRRQYEVEGKDVLPKQDSEVTDSNIITPGTTFMFELSKQLQTYVHLRVSKNDAWKHLKVILSDANAHGEGEHKIMSFIRLQRTCPGYNPNTHHVLYGLDADLIMLALATHELHFSILRENVLAEDKSKTSHSSVLLQAGNSETNVVKCRGWFKQFDLNSDKVDISQQMNKLDITAAGKQKLLVKKPHQFLHVWILREYLNFDLRSTNVPENFEYDIERLIDDFIFICFFGGNDFLPHMPTLEIHEGGIDLLIHVYKQEFKNLGGYLVNMEKVYDKKGGYIKVKRVEKFILALGTYEDQIFKKRSAIHESKLRRMFSEFKDESGNGEEELFPVISTHNQKGPYTEKSPDHDVQVYDIIENTKALKEQLKSYNREISDVFRNGLLSDMVKLDTPGWRKRYYKYKFSAETDADVEKMRKEVVERYTEGLCWVLLYYFSGVVSWTWFYPFHYGPFASDFKGLSSTKVTFQRGSPFKPFDQLMSVLPPTSAHALPPPYRLLMTTDDSNILDFYPNDFDVDTDGKRFLWQGICKLPFIDEKRLLASTKMIEKELTEEEAQRNAENADKLFLHSEENLALQIISSFNNEGSIEQKSSMKVDTGLSGDINGFVYPNLEPKYVCDVNDLGSDHDVLCVFYDPPCFSHHIPRVLEGTDIPDSDVSEADIKEVRLWHESHGYPVRSNRCHGQPEEDKIDPSVGLASGWRGRVNEIASSSQSRIQERHFRHGTHSYPNRSNRSYEQVQGAQRSPTIRAVGGWSGRGRGRGHDATLNSQSTSRHDATRTPKEQTNCSSWWDTHGRGARRNGNCENRSINYNGRTSTVNGQFWAVRSESSSSNQGRGQWGDAKSKNASNRRW
ncbi:5'-3' exoribonuclease 3 [Lactuca sativa]|uniref:5'-3' exoribonuclease 3 n=1 Tax=Lactuca sativa TaxID=4236 RepID=UPI000CD9AA14|nr:5'-3' exoribonuclease 3 [Lactuca sativa]